MNQGKLPLAQSLGFLSFYVCILNNINKGGVNAINSKYSVLICKLGMVRSSCDRNCKCYIIVWRDEEESPLLIQTDGTSSQASSKN